MKIISYNFSDFPQLNSETKELIGLGSWSMFELKDKQFLIIAHGGCACHGHRESKYFLLNEEGKPIAKPVDKDTYKQEDLINIIRFNIPKEITKNYLQIKF